MQKTLVCLSLGLLTLTLILFTLSSSAYAGAGVGTGGGAGASPPTSCDPKFMEALRKRAWMETQREVVSNAATIWRPDSVMQLTCFDRQLGAMKRSGGAGFSEKEKPTDKIDPKTGKASTVYDGAIDAAAGDLVENHLKGNAGGTLKGTYIHQGRMPNMGPNYQFDSAETGQPFNCDNMEALWEAAKCQNINEDEAFVSLTALSTGQSPNGTVVNDPRKYGGQCGGYAKGTFATNDALLKTPGVGSTGFSPASLFAAVTAPYSQLKGSNGAQLNCFPGIKTGVKLGSSGGGVDEVVCPNPGCIPDNGTCKPQS